MAPVPLNTTENKCQTFLLREHLASLFWLQSHPIKLLSVQRWALSLVTETAESVQFLQRKLPVHSHGNSYKDEDRRQPCRLRWRLFLLLAMITLLYNVRESAMIKDRLNLSTPGTNFIIR